MLDEMINFFRHKSSAAEQESKRTALQAKANRGDAEAQFSLGLHFGNVSGDALDYVEAARWYGLAAAQSHVLAQFNLGVMFARGQGMPQDDVQAANWMRKAAEGGDAGGQHDLGLRCHRASLDPLRPNAVESRIEAYKWLHLAAEQGYRGSLTTCQRVTLTMTRTEVDEGNQRAAAFTARIPSESDSP